MLSKKADVMTDFDDAFQRLDNETFFQVNTIGCGWIFVTANENYHIQITLDRLDNTLRIEMFNRFIQKEKSIIHHIRANLTNELHDRFVKFQNKHIFNI